MIDLRVETFITLCEYKNYTKAARALCITQPAVSQHIKYLEEYYKVKLVDPNNRRFTLTVAGEKFLEYAIAMQNHGKQIEKILEDTQEVQVTMEFGATLSIGGYLVVDALEAIILEKPKLKLSMLVENTAHLLEKLLKGDLDFAFVEGYFNKEKFHVELLKVEPFVLVVAKDHPLAAVEVATLEQIQAYTLLLREKGSGTRAILERALEDWNSTIHNFKSILEIGNFEVIKQLVTKGHGISFMYRTVVEKELASGVLKEVQLDKIYLEREFNFVCMKDTMLQKEYVALCDFVKSHL